MAAVRCLKVFFLDAYEHGDLLSASRVCKLLAIWNPSHAPITTFLMVLAFPRFDQATDADDARRVYRTWLHRHHAAYHSQLLSLIKDGAPPVVQVWA